MRFLNGKSLNRHERDTYVECFQVEDDKFFKCVWPESTWIGPCAFDIGHIDRINARNAVSFVVDPEFGLAVTRVNLRKDKAKFRP